MEKVKIVLKWLSVLVFMFLFVYCIEAFYAVSFNIKDWTEGQRGVSGVFAFIVSILFFIVVIVETEEA
jgi:hypothetical protein